MAGESTLPTEHYPDEFTVSSHLVTGADLANFPWIYADRTLVIDSVTVENHGTAVGGTATMQLVEVASGTVPTSANIDSGTAITNAISIAANSAATAGTMVTTANTIALGSWLCVKVAAGGGTLGNFRGAIQIRYRTRQK